MNRFTFPDDYDPLDDMDNKPEMDLHGWLSSLPTRDFNHLWVGAVMSSIIEDGMAVPELASVLSLCRDRMRDMPMPPWLVKVVVKIEEKDRTEDDIDQGQGQESRL